MSTSGFICYIHEGKRKGTYNHSDSYPDGLGQEIVSAIRGIDDWNKFRENYAKVKWVKHGYRPTEEEINEHIAWSNLDVGGQSKYDVYCLLRNLQGAPQIEEISKGTISLLEESNYLGEYSYVLDLDKLELIFYEDKEVKGKCPLEDIPENWMEYYA